MTDLALAYAHKNLTFMILDVVETGSKIGAKEITLGEYVSGARTPYGITSSHTQVTVSRRYF